MTAKYRRVISTDDYDLCVGCLFAQGSQCMSHEFRLSCSDDHEDYISILNEPKEETTNG